MADRHLVVGACGFSGSHLVDELVGRGVDVVATDLPGSDTSYVDRAGVPFLPADLTRPDTLEGVFDEGPFDGVYHFGEISSHSLPLEPLVRVNEEGTRNLLEAMRRHDVPRLMALGSGGVYGNPDYIPADEETPHRPLTPYDVSKSRMEEAVREAGRSWGLKWTVLRPAAMYGPRSRKGAAVPIFLLALGQMPGVPGKRDCVAAFTHVRDVVGAARFLMHHPRSAGEAFNVADDTLITVQDLLNILAPHLDARIFNVQLPQWGLRLLSWWNARRSHKTGRTPRIERHALVTLMHDTFMSNRKLKDAGYTLRYPDAVLGMVETISWYKAHNWLWREAYGRRELPGAPPA